MLSHFQFVIFKLLSYCFKETIRFDVKASFASRPVSRLIRWYNKPCDKTKNFEKSLFSSTGLFMDWKLETVFTGYVFGEEGGFHKFQLFLFFQMKQIKALKQIFAQIKHRLKLAKKTPEKYKLLYCTLLASIFFETYTYFSLRLFYLNLKEEPKAVAETGKHFRLKSCISLLLAVVECSWEGDGDSSLLGRRVFLKWFFISFATQLSCWSLKCIIIALNFFQ